jgi:hypothetical protein
MSRLARFKVRARRLLTSPTTFRVAVLIVGGWLVVRGVGMVSPPAAWIACGSLVIGWALLSDDGKPKR